MEVDIGSISHPTQISESALLVKGGKGVARQGLGGEDGPPLAPETCLQLPLNAKQEVQAPKSTYLDLSAEASSLMIRSMWQIRGSSRRTNS